MNKKDQETFRTSALTLAEKLKWELTEGQPVLKDQEETVDAIQCPGVTQEQATALNKHLSTVALATRISGLKAIANDFSKEAIQGDNAEVPLTFVVPFASGIDVTATIKPQHTPKPVAGKEAGAVKFGHVIANSVTFDRGPASVYDRAGAEYSKAVADLFGTKE